MAAVSTLPVPMGTGESRLQPPALNRVCLSLELDPPSTQLMPVERLVDAQPHSTCSAEHFHSHGWDVGWNMQYGTLPSSGIKEAGRKAVAVRCQPPGRAQQHTAPCFEHAGANPKHENVYSNFFIPVLDLNCCCVLPNDKSALK